MIKTKIKAKTNYRQRWGLRCVHTVHRYRVLKPNDASCMQQQFIRSLAFPEPSRPALQWWPCRSRRAVHTRGRRTKPGQGRGGWTASRPGGRTPDDCICRSEGFTMNQTTPIRSLCAAVNKWTWLFFRTAAKTTNTVIFSKKSIIPWYRHKIIK